mgnify:CR=1 FL=1
MPLNDILINEGGSLPSSGWIFDKFDKRICLEGLVCFHMCNTDLLSLHSKFQVNEILERKNTSSIELVNTHSLYIRTDFDVDLNKYKK